MKNLTNCIYNSETGFLTGLLFGSLTEKVTISPGSIVGVKGGMIIFSGEQAFFCQSISFV
jgi:hypothetical protein